MALAVISCSFGQSCDIAPVVPGGNPGNTEQVLGSHPDYPADNSSGDSAVLPVAQISANASVLEGEEVVLDGSASSDPAGQPLSFHWQQSGNPTVELQDADTAIAHFVTPYVDADTTLSFTLTVTNNSGQSNKTVSVLVTNALTTSGLVTISASVTEGEAPLSVDFSATAAEGQSLPDGATYMWDFGDGSTGEEPQLNHVFNNAGIYTVVLCTAIGGTLPMVGCDDKTINVSGKSGDDTAKGIGNKGAGTTTSPTYTISGHVRLNTAGLAGIAVAANNGGGSAVTDADGFFLVTVARNWSGLVTPATTPYLPTPGSRSYSALKLNMADQDFSATTASTPPPPPPPPANIMPVVDQGTSIALSTAQDTAGTVQISATDSDAAASSLTWTISSPATSGTASVLSGSPSSSAIGVTINYQPNTNFSGSDAFTVQVNDGAGGTDSIVVNATVTASASQPPPPPPPPSPTGNTYYVATTGLDSNPGTEAQPFKTLSKAAATVRAGDVVYVRGGTYNTVGYPSQDAEATTTLLVTTDGTSTAPIRFEGYQNEPVILDGRLLNSNALSIQSNYIIVKKMSFKNCKRAGARMYASWRTSGVAQPTAGPPLYTGTPTGRKVIGSQIIECIAHNNSTASTGYFPGIQVRGLCENCTIEYCVSYANGRGILFEEESSVNTFRTWPLYEAAWPDAPVNCTLHGCVVFSNLKDDENSDGIQGRYMTGCTFKDCISYGNVDDNFDAVASSDCVFDGNIAFNANPNATLNGDGNGMKLDTRRGGGNIVRHNISFLNPRAGFDNDDGSSDFYHNNVAYRNGVNNTLGYGFLVESDVAANKLVNNISYLNTTGDVTLSRDCPNAPPFAPIVDDYNYWGDAEAPFNPCTNLNFGDTHSYAFGANSKGLGVAGDPKFVNPPSSVSQIDTSAVSTVQAGGIQSLNSALLSQIRGKFTLQSGSPCINAGINAAAYYTTPGTMSFNGTAPDLGAVEAP